MTPTNAVLIVLGGYVVYRHVSTSGDSNANLSSDLTSTFFTIKEWAVQSDIPFNCIDPVTKRDYKTDIQNAARLTGVPALLLAALIRQESGFKATARNTASGAMGLGQFMPPTAREWFGTTWQNGVYDPDRAIPMTARYLAWLYRRHGTWRLAVAAYNWGTGNVAKLGLAKAPKETRDYVRIVFDTWKTTLPE